MKIFAHRGIWDDKKDQNTIVAFKRALDLGFGIELDVRDSFGQLVISHDPAASTENLQLEEVIELVSQYESSMAINVKSDGLLKGLVSTLRSSDKEKYFVFDMSIPETIRFLNSGLRTFMRVSEFEKPSSLHEHASGVWLDAFESDWWTKDSQVFQDFQTICVVSPELHGRNKEVGWGFLRGIAPASNLSLCTDYPEKASDYFR